MTTDIILPFEDDRDAMLEAMSYYGIRLVEDFSSLPGGVGGVWQIEGDPEMLEKLVSDYKDMIAYC